MIQISKVSIKPTRTPLAEATIEVRFPGDLRLDVWRGEFQQKVREEYPLLFVPSVNQGDFPALQHYQFVNETQTTRVSLALNSLAFSTMEYPGWVFFEKEFLSYYRLLIDYIQPRKLTRIGVRYVNQFDSELVSMLKRSYPKKYLAGLALNPEYYLSVTRFATNIKGCKLLVNVQKENDLLVLDYDAFMENARPEEIVDSLRALHSCVESEFFDVLKPKYAESLVLRLPKEYRK